MARKPHRGNRLDSAQAALPERSISVTGESVVFIRPDRVDVGIGVEMFGDGPEAVAAPSGTAAERVLSAIRMRGVADRHIQTQALKMDVRYLDREPHEGVAGYLVRREYVVTLSDPSMAGKVVATALSNGANLLLGVDYRRQRSAPVP